MFGFSLTKILVLAVILGVVWYGFKLLNRRISPRRPVDDDGASAGRIDTVYDPETDTYVPKDSRRPTDRR